MAHQERSRSRGQQGRRRRGFGDSFENSVALMRPVSVRTKEACDDCGGSGSDIGALSATEPEVCESCHGTRKQTVTSGPSR